MLSQSRCLLQYVFGCYSYFIMVYCHIQAAPLLGNVVIIKYCFICQSKKIYIWPSRAYKYLSHVILKNSLKANYKKYKVIQEWPERTNLGELHSFLGIKT